MTFEVVIYDGVMLKVKENVGTYWSGGKLEVLKRREAGI